MSSQFNISARLKQGRKIDREKYKEEEKGKLGVLRAGSSGIRAENGDIAGACHRKSHLRSLGIEVDPPTDQKLIMFQLGYSSEDIIYDDLIKTSGPDEVILREDEIPIGWCTSNGVVVSGRPDMVLCRRGVPSDPEERMRGNVPLLGLELKSVHSVWVARDVLFGRTPKLNNLIQAAHYMWKLDIPYRLVYKGYSSLGQGMAWSDKMAGMFPRPGEPGSEFMEYNERGKPKQVCQFEIVYELELDKHGRVKYRVEEADKNDGKWTSSLVTTGDLERYYEYLSVMAEQRDLGPRPLTLDAQGGKLNYTDCQYCPLQAVCDKYEEDGYEKWLNEVKRHIGSNSLIK